MFIKQAQTSFEPKIPDHTIQMMMTRVYVELPNNQMIIAVHVCASAHQAKMFSNFADSFLCSIWLRRLKSVIPITKS